MARTTRILLVEDNHVNRMVAEQMLQNAGFDVDVAENGAEALKKLSAVRYGLVLMDIQMPVMDGVSACRRIRDPHSSVLDHDVPVIAMTAYGGDADRFAFAEAGMDEYLPKPLHMESFIETVSRMMAGPRAAVKGGVGAAPAAAAVGETTPAAGLPPPATGAAGADQFPFVSFDRRDLALRIGNDTEFMARVVSRFGTVLARMQHDVHTGLGAANADVLFRAAHSLHGAAANASAIRLQKICREIANCVRGAAKPGTTPADGGVEPDWALIADLVAILDAEVVQLTPKLRIDP